MIYDKPTGEVFASQAHTGEVVDFPNVLRGWGITKEQAEGKPPMSWMNDAFRRVDQNIEYLRQNGIPEWDEKLTYPKNAITRQGNILYLAKVENTGNEPNTSIQWQSITDKASTSRAGIVQLSNAVDSNSETTAATSKAVKIINDNVNTRVPASRRINGYPLSDDVVIDSTDIFNNQAKVIEVNEDLNDYRMPGIYFQHTNTIAATGKNYPEALAGSLVVYRTAGVIQVYHVYDSSRIYSRAYNAGSGRWTAWVKTVTALDYQQSFGATGWQKLPSGLILQWGTLTPLNSGSTMEIKLPIAFPNATMQAFATHDNANHATRPTIYAISSTSRTTVTATATCLSATAVGATVTRGYDTACYGRYLAIGY